MADQQPVDPTVEPSSSAVGSAYVQGHGAGFQAGFDAALRARRLLSGDGFVLHETATDDRERPCVSHVGRLELATIRFRPRPRGADDGLTYLAYRVTPRGGEAGSWQAIADLQGSPAIFTFDGEPEVVDLLEVRRRNV